MSREIYAKTSVLMSQLQITFPVALSSIPGSQHADTKGGMLPVTETSVSGEELAYCFVEIHLILTQQNPTGPNWLCYMSHEKNK